MRLHAVHLRHRGAHRTLELLGDVVRSLERDVTRELQVQRELGATVDLQEREVVHLADARDRDRGGVRTLPDACILQRLDVDDDVAPG